MNRQLAVDLRSSRARLRALTQDIDGERLFGPRLAIVNPFLWELGHVAWFQEYWCLRRRADGSFGDSILPAADALYDSSKIAHDLRWDLPLPALEATHAYQEAVIERVEAKIEREHDSPDLSYFVQLAVFHEDMHAEAFHYMRQTLGYPAPQLGEARVGVHTAAQAGAKDVEIAGGRYLIGARADSGFVFDNEKWEHEVQLAPFRIARCALANSDYLQFVEADGYLRREFWSDAGWQWREASGMQAPRYWRRVDGAWQQRRFDRWLPLAPREPVLHLNWHEAQAYCRYAGRRLPTEAEWEAAAAGPLEVEKRRYPWGKAAPEAERANLEAQGPLAVDALPSGASADGCLQLIGNVWEWTESAFGPYPGFTPDPYKEYSQPWFGTHRVLRGGSFSTPARLIRNTWRNFYTPERGDIFAGLRTCALES